MTAITVTRNRKPAAKTRCGAWQPRFDCDETYAYLPTEAEGFVGNILELYDIRDPARPGKVSQWWLPGQNAAAGEKLHPRGRITVSTTR